MKFIRDMFTEADGISFCPVRVGGGLGVVSFLGLSAYSVVHGQPFDPQSWGMGFGSVLAGIGGGIWGKKGVEQ